MKALLCVILFGVLLAEASFGGERKSSFLSTTNTPAIARETAIQRAAQYIGIGAPVACTSETTTVTAEYGLATDNWIPFFKVVNRPAWRVTFAGLTLDSYQVGKGTAPSPSIKTLIVLLDGQNGALLMITSPPDPDTPAPHYPPSEEGNMIANKRSFTETALIPPIPFLKAITSDYEARQVFAYHGLLTDALNPQLGIGDALYWIVVQSGLNLHEYISYTDARTGARLEARGLGGLGSRPPPRH